MPTRSDSRRAIAAAAVATLACVSILTLACGFARQPLLRGLQVMAIFLFGTTFILSVVALVILRLAGWHGTEEEFDRLIAQSEALAAGDGKSVGALERLDIDGDCDGQDDSDPARRFAQTLRDTIDALPLELHRALEHIEIIVLDSPATSPRLARGRRLGPYGSVRRDPDASGPFSEWIVVHRARLLRDFGADAELVGLALHNMLSLELTRVLAERGEPSRRGARGL